MAHSDSLVGKHLGGYEILRELGRGGMGVVYKAHEQSLQRVVALKVLAPRLADDPAFLKRFKREARSAASLNHPNIVTVYAVGKSEGIPYIAMEYVKGRSLAELLREEGMLHVGEALGILRQTAEAIEEAHRVGIVHRDIKPQNIMIDPAGRVKVMDFGLAKAMRGASQLTETGTTLGTPQYMAPEQVEGKVTDGRADLFALGIVLYEMLAGHPPFQGDSPAVVMYQIRHAPLPRIEGALEPISPELMRLLDDLTKKDVSRRCPSAGKVLEALASCDPSFSREHAAPKTTRGLPRRADAALKRCLRAARLHRTYAVTVAIALTAAIVLVVIAASGRNASSPDPFEVRTMQGIEMVWIPPGKFLMGSGIPAREVVRRYATPNYPASQFEDEHPRHWVRLTRGFWLGRFEITNAQFKRFVDATGYTTEAENKGSAITFVPGEGGKHTLVAGINWRTPGWETDENLPAVCISLGDARAYVDWLNVREGGRFRIPTEAQWEYACRAGTTTVFPWGDDLLEGLGWLNGGDETRNPVGGRWARRFPFEDGYWSIAPPGQFKPNAWGLYDMLGNVYEWCADRKGAYPRDSVADPAGPSSGDVWLLRGGSWSNSPAKCRPAFRVGVSADHAATWAGLRLACDP